MKVGMHLCQVACSCKDFSPLLVHSMLATLKDVEAMGASIHIIVCVP